MSDDKTPLDQLLDLCVFGPIGLLVAGVATLIHYRTVRRQAEKQFAADGNRVAPSGAVGADAAAGH